MIAFLKKWSPLLLSLAGVTAYAISTQFQSFISGHVPQPYSSLALSAWLMLLHHLPSPFDGSITAALKKMSAPILLFVLAFTMCGCPKSPYSAAIRGSDDIAAAVHLADDITANYYGTGKLNDTQKKDIASILNTITDSNMTFRHAVVAAKNAGVVDKAAYVALAQSFVNSMPEDPAALKYYSADAQKLYHEVLDPVRAAITVIAGVVGQSKGSVK